MLVALMSVLRLADCVDVCTEVGWICICSDAGCIDACVDVMCSDDCIDVSCGAGVSEGIDLLLKSNSLINLLLKSHERCKDVLINSFP